MMAVRHIRGRIVQRISSFSNEKRKSYYRSSRSSLNLRNISSPKEAQMNKNSVQCNKDLRSTKRMSKEVAYSNMQSSFYNSPETKQKKSKQGQAQTNSLHGLVTPTLDRIDRQGVHRMQRKLPTKLNRNSTPQSLNILETSIITRSQRKVLNSNMEVLRKSKDHTRKGRSLVQDANIMNSPTETSRQTSLENLKTPVSSLSQRKSLDINTNAAKQNEKRSILPIIDCLMSSNSCKTPSFVCNNVLSQEEVKSKTQGVSDECSKIRKGKYHLRSQSEKILNRSKPASHCGKRMKSLPIDDLVCLTSKSVSNNNRKIGKPISIITPKELHPPNSEFRVLKISSENILKKEKSKSLSTKTVLSGVSNSVPSKGTLKRKRWIFNTLKEKNDGYEDDIFETKKFDKMKAALEISDDESDTTDNSIVTPKCGFLLTPSLPKKTPLYKECISSSELLEARKVAEEYLFRRNKKWKTEIKNSFKETTGTSEIEKDLPEKKKLVYAEALKNVVNAQKNIEKLTQEESEEEDAYFSEVSD